MLRFLIVIICLCALLSAHITSAQNSKAATIKEVNKLTALYKKGQLSDTGFSNQMFGTMRGALSNSVDFSNKELLQLLRVYKVAAVRIKNKRHLRRYYAVFSNQAQMAGRYGEMLYYAEKIDELERQMTGRKSLSGLTVIMDYYDKHQLPEKVREIFMREKDYLLQTPELVNKKVIGSSDQSLQALAALEKSANALYKLGDTLIGNEVVSVMERLAGSIRSTYHPGNDIIANINCSLIFVNYQQVCASAENPGRLQAVFRRLEELLTDGNTPGYLKKDIEATLVDWKLGYYMYYKNIDSSRYYLRIYDSLNWHESNPGTRFRLKWLNAKTDYDDAAYRKSADELFDAVLIIDSMRGSVVKNVDEMLYAQAKADDQQVLLDEARASKRLTERRLLIAGIIIVVLIMMSLFMIQYIRRKQRDRFIEFKLSMARNIHDETGPALLYAKALAKAKRTEELMPEKSELEKQIERTMEVIRHLSHDLKSERLIKLPDLTHEIRTTLNKLNPDNTFKYSVTETVDKKRFISHQQFTHIRAILHECLSNTIKHAEFELIQISFKQEKNRLAIKYSDDGKGWDSSNEYVGIGLQNIKERVMDLNGACDIENRYPYGYDINIVVTLR
ncbi:sensor histidine kinase [Taibaiella koreensis]|uniref:sensor histidine kinase n=1 Tax=Taibaiella koreensis TaxID=1268548 RepID=UPI000E5A0B5C|nr:hypothetical protein [Taibaiella koreensis]